MSDEVGLIVPAIRAVLDAALAAGRVLTAGGKGIDEHQVHAERLAYAATEAAAAEAVAAYARERAGDDLTGRMASAFAGDVACRLRAVVEAHRDDFGVSDALLARTLGAPEVIAAVRAAQHESRFREIGREVVRTRGANNSWIDGDVAEMARDSARGFARKEVVPLAERIHRHDDLVPDTIIRQMAELGYFGMSVPEEYGARASGTS
jgi:(2S)-methylsuccinyl-CoA dehydrogenase